MEADESLTALVARVKQFHITDRAMLRAQREIEAALQSGTVDGRGRESYLQAVHRYFDGFSREAKTALREVDRRLADLHQLEFNATAERNVVIKRVEATETVLREAARIEKMAHS